MASIFARRTDGVTFAADSPVISALPKEARDRLFIELDDTTGRPVPSEFERRQAAERQFEAARAEALRARNENMARDGAERPAAKEMTRDQLLVDIGRALHSAFPDRADELVTELEGRLLERFNLVLRGGEAVVDIRREGRWFVRVAQPGEVLFGITIRPE